jgi:hypothetical protein
MRQELEEKDGLCIPKCFQQEHVHILLEIFFTSSIQPGPLYVETSVYYEYQRDHEKKTFLM